MPRPELSIVIPVLNDTIEINATLKSLQDSIQGDQQYEVIIVDDCSDAPVTIDAPLRLHNVRMLRNHERLGVGPSRHLGVQMAWGEYIFLVDAHTRFIHGWFEKAMHRIAGRNQTIHNGVCLGLNYEEADCIEKAKGRYCAASLLFYDDHDEEIFEGKWLPKAPPDDSEIACLMGACYLIPKEWFLKIGGLKALRMWGGDEPYLSLKCWMAGGQIRFMNELEIGHKFRDVTPYSTEVWNLIYNKLRPAYELFNDTSRDCLIEKLKSKPTFTEAMQRIQQDMADILVCRDYYQHLFVHDLDWFCDKFDIKNRYR